MQAACGSASAEIAVHCLEPSWKRSIPGVETLAQRTAGVAIASAPTAASLDRPFDLSIVLVDDGYIRALNRKYRDCDKPTNVLAFPYQDKNYRLPGTGPLQLGDVVLACETLEREALEQGKPVENHFCHLLVHGILHLLGYDHDNESQAREMEALEVETLSMLGIPDPYREIEDRQ